MTALTPIQAVVAARAAAGSVKGFSGSLGSNRAAALLCDAEVYSLLRRRIAEAGGSASFARRHGIGEPYLCMVLGGTKPVGPFILTALGLRKLVRYESI